METVAETGLEGAALDAWRSYLQSHASIVRVLDADLAAEHGMTTRDYEVLLYLSQAEGRRLPMSALAESTMLTRSGITRLVDGLVEAGLIERVACPNDARVSYAQLTDAGYEKLRQAGCSHVASIRRLFLEHFSPDEIEQLAALLEPAARAPARRPVHRRVAAAPDQDGCRATVDVSLADGSPTAAAESDKPRAEPAGRSMLDSASFLLYLVAHSTNSTKEHPCQRPDHPRAHPSGVYSVDPAHSNVGFEVRHMGIATVRGKLRQPSRARSTPPVRRPCSRAPSTSPRSTPARPTATAT